MYKDIKLDKGEVLRYLGYNNQSIDGGLDGVIDECMEEILKISRYRYTYRIFDIRKSDYCIELDGTSVRLTGSDIYDHLADCPKCALLAVTIGIETDNAIRIAQNTDMLKAVVLDACATELAEKVCDMAEDEIKAIAAEEGLGTNFRFSPGYGDLPLDAQKGIINALDAGRKIGLTLTDSSIMIPGKSVTAIIGFTKDRAAMAGKSGCDICSMKDTCKFRKAGTTCGSN